LLKKQSKAFRAEISKLQNQAIVQAKSQLAHGSMLTEIINLLKKSSIINEDTNTSPQPEVANPPQVIEAGGSDGAAGHGQQSL
jgi:hypothetical protein